MSQLGFDPDDGFDEPSRLTTLMEIRNWVCSPRSFQEGFPIGKGRIP
jgi:hypothetical protein